MYCILFVYVRLKVRNLRSLVSTNNTGTVEVTRTWHVDPDTTPSAGPSGPNFRTNVAAGERACERMNRASVILISYPVVYICLTMPMCIARICQFAGKSWSLPAVYAGTVIYVCSGAVNVLVYTATREGIIPWRRLFNLQRKHTKTDQTSTKSDDAPDSYYSKDDTDLVTSPSQLVAINPSIAKLNAERAAPWTKV
jgi:G protein-coupled glucose receptor regulating Gpa2 C-term